AARTTISILRFRTGVVASSLSPLPAVDVRAADDHALPVLGGGQHALRPPKAQMKDNTRNFCTPHIRKAFRPSPCPFLFYPNSSRSGGARQCAARAAVGAGAWQRTSAPWLDWGPGIKDCGASAPHLEAGWDCRAIWPLEEGSIPRRGD